MAGSAFEATFARTLAEAPKEWDDNYEGTHGRPVTLPEMEASFPCPTNTEHDTSLLEVGLKSIRNPKFHVRYSVPRTDTIYALKERLLTDPTGPLASSSYAPVNIKILQKKVITDTRQLSELPSTDFTVMFVTATEAVDVPLPSQVYWGSEANTETQTAVKPVGSAAQPVKSAPKQKPGINESFWKDIEAVARRYVDDASGLIDQFRTVVASNELYVD